ncbi:14577_t:CDS:2 [Acaulospora colombiana]|uniref:14577_t:CDS:1 n=1 Tax=Acaulospora colombiana TaxID=27376 RepID=A0ACA9N7H3_9GLOM|nr:14577_t:CDS:2 [Acaulospora colombiana]
MADLLSPFSSTALAALPRNPTGHRERETRADRIPSDPNYGTMDLPPGVRVPQKLATPIKVEGKVWLAAERSEQLFTAIELWLWPFYVANMYRMFSAWISYLNIALLLAMLALTLFNASPDEISKKFAYTYALISIGVLQDTAVGFDATFERAAEGPCLPSSPVSLAASGHRHMQISQTP